MSLGGDIPSVWSTVGGKLQKNWLIILQLPLQFFLKLQLFVQPTCYTQKTTQLFHCYYTCSYNLTAICACTPTVIDILLICSTATVSTWNLSAVFISTATIWRNTCTTEMLLYLQYICYTQFNRYCTSAKYTSTCYCMCHPFAIYNSTAYECVTLLLFTTQLLLYLQSISYIQLKYCCTCNPFATCKSTATVLATHLLSTTHLLLYEYFKPTCYRQLSCSTATVLAVLLLYTIQLLLFV